MQECKITSLFNLEETIAKDLFAGKEYPWEVLSEIKDFIIKLGESLDPEIYDKRGENIWIAKSANVFDSAYLTGPLIVDENAEIRHCAFIRGSVIVGKKSVIGNSTEVKNSIIFNNCEVPHYNYVGDSVLGFHAHMGAGSITSNIKSDRKNVVIHGERDLETGIRKIGAMLGDYAEIGCGTVLNPGSVIGSHTTVYPLSFVRGVVPGNSIYKNRSEFEIVSKKED